MNNTTLYRFNEWLDILMYVAHAKREVGANELMDQVTNYERSRLNYILRMMVQGGYLERTSYNTGHMYLPTQKTRQIFGVHE